MVIAWGDKDPWEPIALGKAYGEYDTVEEFVVLPNVGHCPQVRLVPSSPCAVLTVCFEMNYKQNETGKLLLCMICCDL